VLLALAIMHKTLVKRDLFVAASEAELQPHDVIVWLDLSSFGWPSFSCKIETVGNNYAIDVRSTARSTFLVFGFFFSINAYSQPSLAPAYARYDVRSKTACSEII
jgi:hypothetical protein